MNFKIYKLSTKIFQDLYLFNNDDLNVKSDVLGTNTRIATLKEAIVTLMQYTTLEDGDQLLKKPCLNVTQSQTAWASPATITDMRQDQWLELITTSALMNYGSVIKVNFYFKSYENFCKIFAILRMVPLALPFF